MLKVENQWTKSQQSSLTKCEQLGSENEPISQFLTNVPISGKPQVLPLHYWANNNTL